MSAEMMVISEDIRKIDGLFCWDASVSISAQYPYGTNTPFAGFL